MGAAAGAGMAAGGGLLSAYSQIQAGKEGLKAAKRQQSYLNDQAADIVAQGDFNADMANEQGRQAAASQRTGFAANGVVVGEGTAGRVEQDSITMAKQDASQLRRNAFNEAMGLVTQGEEAVRQAKFAKKQSKINALGSLLTGGGQAYGIYSRG